MGASARLPLYCCSIWRYCCEAESSTWPAGTALVKPERLHSGTLAQAGAVAQGATAAPKNGVAVVDSPPLRVLSVGMRGGGGAGGEPPLALARRVLEARLAVGDLESTGYWRQLGYNSPMVTPSERFWELQVGVCERQ